MRNLSIMIAAALALSACQTPAAPDDATLYYGFARLDPDREEIVEDAWLAVAGEMIARTGGGAPPLGRYADRRDMTGLFALPGFVDAHAHITAGPHKIEFRDGAPAVTIESVDEITQFSARMALAFGVTTVRNPGGDPVANARYDENIAAGVWVGPDALHAGAIIQPPPFVGGAFAYPQTEEEWNAEAARQAALGMTYFKLYQNLTEDELATGVRVAHEHGLKAIAHLNMVSWMRAVELGIDGLEHALPTSPDLLEPEQREKYLADLGPNSKFYYRWFELADFDGPLIGALVELLVKEQVQVNMTLGVNEIVYNADRLDEIIPVEDHRFAHPQNLAASLGFLEAGRAGWSPEDHERGRAAMPKVLAFAKMLYDAGVPMMLGTDGNGGGPTFAHEAALHVEAGIPVWNVLRMITSDNAEMLGLGERTGRIAAGMEADIVFLRKNPAEDISRLRDVELVIANGKAHSFAALTYDVAELE